MSQKKYCPACGKATEYVNGVAPTSCGACKKPFAAAFKVTASETPIPQKKISKKTLARKLEDETDEEDEDGEFYGEIIIPKKFEVEINMPKRMTIGGLANGDQFLNLGQNLGPSDIE